MAEAKEAPAAPAYDAENTFAKILDKKLPCFKVYESRVALAFLDAFPAVEGHTLVVPKLKGYPDVVSMPPHKAADFLGEVQKVARAVQKAFDAEGVHIFQNSGAAAGQTVFHPHFHILPRKSGDSMKDFKLPGGKDTLTEAAATPIQAKLEEALRPKIPLRKAKWASVSAIKPEKSGMNLKVKVLEEVREVDSKVGKFYEVRVGDPTGTVVLSLRENQKDVAKKDAVIALRNAATKMVAGHVRIAVDKWGKVEACDEAMDEAVEMDEGKNISEIEYELVTK